MHIRKVTFLPDKYPTAEHYPFNQAVFHETPAVTFDTPVTFFVGENGAGKSTLIEALADACGIHMWRGLERTPFKYNPYERQLHRYIKVEWANGTVPGSFFASDIFQHFVESLDEWAAADPGMLKYFGGKSLVTQSHGQSLMAYFAARYKLRGLYLLDEPETALSPKTQLALVRLIREMADAGHAQFIVASHSPILLACPGARILSFDHSPIAETTYEETDYYRVYKGFLEDRTQFF
ncbi:MAG: AAA family ATPase [Candidatus Hydrogenedentes bacterium]|nr:AAA family ATPase [Candidatus Hydrogenedentota bacterium]